MGSRVETSDMGSTHGIREWLGNVRWKAGSVRDGLIEGVLAGRSWLITHAGRVAWMIETRLASARLRRTTSESQQIALARAMRLFSKDADSIIVRPRLIALGILVLLASGFLIGYAMAPRSDYRPSGLNVLPPGSWQSLPSNARQGAPQHLSSRKNNPTASTPAPDVARHGASGTSAKNPAAIKPTSIESRPR